MTDLSSVVDNYLSVWNETDPASRREKIDKLWAPDGVYVDPLATVAGRDGFDKLVEGAQGQFQGLKFVRGTTFDAHHNVVRFTWDLVPAEGAEPIVVGFDVATIDDDGLISNVSGFIDKMPATV